MTNCNCNYIPIPAEERAAKAIYNTKISVATAARLVRKSRSTIRRMCAEGHLSAAKEGRQWVIYYGSLLDLPTPMRKELRDYELKDASKTKPQIKDEIAILERKIVRLKCAELALVVSIVLLIAIVMCKFGIAI